MKTITKEEWDNTPEKYKRVYEGNFYMVYRETDGMLCFGPVKVLEKDNMWDFGGTPDYLQGEA